MKVTFQLGFGGPDLLSEEELDRDRPGPGADLAGLADIRGALVLTPDDGPPAVLRDDLSYLASVLLDGVPALKAGKPVEFLYYSLSGNVRLVPEKGSVRVIVTGNEVGRFPLRELLPALVGCVGRVAETFERLGGDDVNVQAAARSLRGKIAALAA